MRVAIYGAGYYAGAMVDSLQDSKKKIEIVYFVETVKTKDYFKNKKVISASDIQITDFDYLVIAVLNGYDEIGAYLKARSDYEILEPKIMRMSLFRSFVAERQESIFPYSSVRLNCGLKYIFSSEDLFIGKSMADYGENYSKQLIDVFFELTDMHYGEKRRTGIFFDIGANIGTTSIYVKKIIAPELKVIGIECGKSNYDLFKVNCIINHIEDICIEHIGFGNKSGKMLYHYNCENPGGSFVVREDMEGEEAVQILRMDDYCKNKGINAETIDYMWIDTEGFEAQIIEGAQGILSNKKIPLLQEFNPITYKRSEMFDQYCENMMRFYDSFIDLHEYLENKIIIRNVNELHKYAELMLEAGKWQTDLFFF